MKIYTHENVDLDAIVSLCGYCLTHNIGLNAESVEFVPANRLDFPADSVLLDLQVAKHAHDLSCVQELFGDVLPKEIVWEITQQDCTGMSFGNLQMVLMGIKKSNVRYTDLEICQYFLPIVDGWMKYEVQRKESISMYATLPQVQIGKYKFLLQENVRHGMMVTSCAIADGVSGTIYLSGYNIGITRFPGISKPNLNRLPAPMGWFQHPAGFLLCFGSRKSNATKWNPQFKNLDAFVDWLKIKFEQYQI